jgi:hypothetical protein
MAGLYFFTAQVMTCLTSTAILLWTCCCSAVNPARRNDQTFLAREEFLDFFS